MWRTSNVLRSGRGTFVHWTPSLRLLHSDSLQNFLASEVPKHNNAEITAINTKLSREIARTDKPHGRRPQEQDALQRFLAQRTSTYPRARLVPAHIDIPEVPSEVYEGANPPRGFKMRNQFTKVDDEIILELRNQGLSFAEIDRQLGLHEASARGRIWRLARRHQDPEAMRHSFPYKGLTSSQKCLVLKLRARKLSLGAIASKLQKPFEAIRTVINDLPNFRTPRKRWSDAEEQTLKRYREEFGLTWREIGQRLGRSGASCAVRYCSKRQKDAQKTLAPKSRFSEEEDEDLLKLKREFGLQWSEVHAYMPHRSLWSLQMRYYHHLQKRP